MRVLFATLILPALMAPAAAATYYVGDNHSWSVSCNASGYKLTSRDPVTRFTEAGANSTVSDGIETLYLGKDCDAQHNALGKGRWCWANGGFRAEFEGGRSIGFPRQELSCPNQNDEIPGCGC
jgi:hypothetical protein